MIAELGLNSLGRLLYLAKYSIELLEFPMSTMNRERMLEELLDSIIDHDIDKIKNLIDQGVEVNGYEDHAKIRPLHYAAQYGFLDVVAFLIEAGADPFAQTCDGETPLDIAKLYEDKSLIVFLKSKMQA